MEKWVKVDFEYPLVTWDEKKRQRTLDERGLNFADAKSVLQGGEGVQRVDDRTDYGEERFQGMARIRVRIFFFAFTVRVPFSARIMSLRKANVREQKAFLSIMGETDE